MLRISDQQLCGFAAAARERYRVTLREHLQSVYPVRAADLAPDALDALLRWAARYGIAGRYDVQRLAELLLESGHALSAVPTTAPLGEYFARSYPSGTARVDDMARAHLLALDAARQ